MTTTAADGTTEPDLPNTTPTDHDHQDHAREHRLHRDRDLMVRSSHD